MAAHTQTRDNSKHNASAPSTGWARHKKVGFKPRMKE